MLYKIRRNKIDDGFQDQILLLDGDVFVEEPVKVLNEIEEFLGIPSYFTKDHFDFSGRKGFPCFKLDEESRSQCMSKGKARDHPDLSEERLTYLQMVLGQVKQKLEEITDADIENKYNNDLEKLLAEMNIDLNDYEEGSHEVLMGCIA